MCDRRRSGGRVIAENAPGGVERGSGAPMTEHTLRFPTDTMRTFVLYDDEDGISVIADCRALLTRYRAHDLNGASDEERAARTIARNPTRTLVELGNAREAVSWGTHELQGECAAILSLAAFSEEELAAHAMGSTVACGCLATEGELFVGGWHAFADGVDFQRGALSCPRIRVPKGTYRVVVHRPFSAEESVASGSAITFLVHLQRVPAHTRDAAITSIPGNDGYVL